MKALTLQGRIIILLAVFTIVTTAIFVSIQLSHEIKTLNDHKTYEASIGKVLVEYAWNDIQKSSLPPEGKLTRLQGLIKLLKQSKIVNDAYVINKEGRFVAASDASLIGNKGGSDDISVLRRANKGESVEEDATFDQDSKSFSFYIPLREDKTPQFIVRLFFSLADMPKAFETIGGVAILVVILLITINIALGFVLAHLLIGPIKIFNDAAKTISSGKLGLRVNIHTNDELEELADTFNYMAMELVKMRERAENANPLTKLPGNIVIHEEIEKRIKTGAKFTVIYCDLDNFKAFNDKYGIAKGDDAIKLTAEIFKDAVKNAGKNDDFIGHEGGDDFILLAKPSYAEAVAHYITSEFDKRVRALYTKEDLDQGYIVAHARDGSVKQFPIMTISLAGVTNEHRPIASYGEVTNIAAEIKKKAKAQMKSCFVLDQRKII